MAYQLPAVDAWPGLIPEQTQEPGLDHFAQDVGRIVEEQHHLLAYFGHGHVSQVFGWWTDEIPLCRGISGSFVKVATYIIRPMLHQRKLIAAVQCNSDQGGTVRVKVVESAVDLDISVAAGMGEIDSGVTTTIDRGGEVTTIELYLRVATSIGGTYLDLFTFCLADADLTVGDLP